MKKTENIYKIALESSGIGFWNWDVQKGSVTSSAMLKKLIGLKKNQTLDFNEYINRIHENDRQRVIKALEKHIAQDVPYDEKFLIRKMDNSYAYWHGQGHAIRDHQGKAKYIVGTVIDLTEKVETEKRLHESETRYKTAIEATLAGIWDWNIENNTVYWTSFFKQMLGFPENYAPTVEEAFNVIHPDDRPLLESKLQEHFVNQIPYELIFRMQHKKGHYLTVRAYGKAIRDNNGTPIRMIGSVIDITEKINTEKEMEKERTLKNIIFDNSEHSIISTTTEGIITSFNKGAEKILGYHAEEMIGKHTPGTFHDTNEIQDRAKELSQELGRKINPGFDVFITHPIFYGTEEREWTYITKAGKRIPVSLTVTALRDSNQKITGYLGIARNIRQQKAEASTLKEAYRISATMAYSLQQKIHAILMVLCNYYQMPNAIVLEKRSGKWTCCESLHLNKESDDWFLKQENPVHQYICHAESVLMVNDIAKIPELQKAFKKTTDLQSFISTPIYVNGKFLGYLLLYSKRTRSPFTQRDQSVLNIIAQWIGNEIAREEYVQQIKASQASLQKASAALEQQKTFLKNLIETMPDAFFIKEVTSNNIIDINKATECLLNKNRQAIIGKKNHEIFPLKTAKEFDKHENYLKEGYLPYDGFICEIGEETDTWIETKLVPIHLKKKLTYILGVARNITERIHLERALRNYTLELEKSNQALDEFVYITSHDLKEPLRGITNYTQFLIEDYSHILGDDGNNKLHRLQYLAKRIKKLIDALLEYSRIGRDTIKIQAINFNELLEDVLSTIENLIKEEKAVITIKKNIPTVLCCDPILMAEVFQNLITNAIKYNTSHQKKIEVGFLKERDGHVNVYYVKDNGIGIAPEHTQMIFKIFKRLHTQDQFKGGTGIGLTIVRKIIEKHDGQIWCESMENKGTTFYFTIPNTPPRAT